ncbi:putative NACHT domain-containing protein [Seiridium cardinale]
MKDFGRRVKDKITKPLSIGRRQNVGALHNHSTSSVDGLRQEPYGMFSLTGGSTSTAGPGTHPVDIIAVHGLNGDAFTTWTHSNGTFWLRDYLPSSLPGCRVYTYGYPSRMFANSYASVRDYARNLISCVRDIHESNDKDHQRSIVFICHSLGGIVCKQALVCAHEDNLIYGDTLGAVKGIVFLGTPHRGSELADIGKVVGQIINTFLPNTTRTDLFTHLGKDSEALQDLASAFRHRLQDLEIATFYEVEPTPPLSSLVVGKFSSILDVPREDIIPLYDNHRDMCQFPSQNNNFKSVSNALKRISLRAHERTGTKSRIDTHLSQHSFDELDKKCIALFSTYGVDDYHRQLPSPVKGTFHWILSHPLFMEWMKESGPLLLWLTGHPGTGKTVMSSFLAEHIERTHGATGAEGVACVYFCDDKISKQRDAKGILLGVIFQIVRRHRSLVRHIRRNLDIQGPSLVQSVAALWKLFLDLVKDPLAQVVYVILDALDECEEVTRHQLLTSIHDFLESSGSGLNHGNSVKFILTSRPTVFRSAKLTKQFSKYCLAIDEGQQGYGEDIQLYIQERVGEIAELPPAFKQYLIETLRSRADQTFLWVHLVLEAMESSLVTSKMSFQDIIDKIPTTLQTTYMDFLAEIPEGHSRLASRLIKLIVGSARPLNLAELNIAVSIHWDHFDAQQVLSNCQLDISRTLLGVLGPLIRTSGSGVSLIHQTVKDFLLKPAMEPQEPHRFTTTAEDCALQIATACVQYLLLAEFSSDVFSINSSPTSLSSHSTLDDQPSTPDSFLYTDSWTEVAKLDFASLYKDSSILDMDTCDKLSKEYEFYRYAALHWAEHYATCEQSAPETLRNAVRRLLDSNSNQYSNLVRFLWAETDAVDSSMPKFVDSVELAAYFDLQGYLKDMLESQELPSATRNKALFWACRRGHVGVVSLLLRVGADPNFQLLENQMAFTVAAEMGNYDIFVNLLKSPHTDINSRGRRGRNALSFAAANGHVDIVRLILGREDSRPDHIDDTGCTALFWAILGGHGHIIQEFMDDSRVHVNHQDSAGRTAISWAASEGQVESLKSLLKDSRVDVNLQDKRGLSPFIWAARYGQGETIRLLAKCRKVRKTTTDNDLRDVVSWVCEQGNTEMLRILIKNGIHEVNNKDIDGWNPMAWATHTDSPEIIETLLLTGTVNLEERDTNGKTALWWAVNYGHLRNVKILLEEGANPEARNNDGISPIDAAREAGRLDLVHELQNSIDRRGA